MKNSSEINKEHLSAFIDNEVDAKTLSQIESTDPLLHRYQLMGEAMRGQVSDAAMVDVSAQMHQVIADEPVYGATPEAVPVDSKESQPWFDFSAWMRPIGGLAVAASVAIVMVMVVNQPDSEGIVSGNGNSQMANIETAPVVSLPVNNTTTNLIDMNKDDKTKEELVESKRQPASGYPQK